MYRCNSIPFRHSRSMHKFVLKPVNCLYVRFSGLRHFKAIVRIRDLNLKKSDDTD